MSMKNAFKWVHYKTLTGYPRYARVPLVMIHIWPLLNSPSNFKICPHMTFDLGWPWPWPLHNQRGVEGYTWCKFGQDRCWGFRDMVVTLKWPLWPRLNSPANWLNSLANFKILPPSDLWPWMTLTLTPYNHRGVKGYKWCDFGQDRCRGSRVIDEHTYILPHIPWIIVRYAESHIPTTVQMH